MYSAVDWGSPLTGENERSHQYSRGSGGLSDGERLLVTSPSLERGLDLNTVKTVAGGKCRREYEHIICMLSLSRLFPFIPTLETLPLG